MTLNWCESLRQTLRQLQPPDRLLRVAIIGVGNEMRGDDCAGVFTARTLRYVLSARPGMLIIDAGSAPESCIGQLRAFGPDLVLFIDSADMDADPGSIQWLDWQVTGGTIGTHGFPLSLLAQYLCDEIGCMIGIIGIQPVQTDLGTPFSSSVRQAVARVVQDTTSILCEPKNAKKIM